MDKAFNLLSVKGRLVLISFHSLEDRIVKNYFKSLSKKCICEESKMQCDCGGDNERVKILTKKAIFPSDDEVYSNRSSRSSRLRAVEKIK